MPRYRIWHAMVAVLLFAALALQGTWALAGTTGGVSGTVTDEGGAPIAGAKVTASSPSQNAAATTDARGRFTFLSLAPDSYTLSVEKEGFTPVSEAGVTVFADNQQTLAIHMSKALKTIAKVSSRAAGNLVKSGTTSDIYSVNAKTQQTIAGMGGGYNMNSAYSAIYAQPGVSSYIGNYGQGQVFYIRGASYGETGYEFDGVPVNRAFDNYNGNSLSNLGQQELQVYTGGSPASGTSATLGGYINQVIKTGTYPGFGTATLGLGAPTFYHNLTVEAGGASPDRMFSWYAGVGGNNQEYREFNNQNAGNISSDGLNSYGFFGTGGFLFPALLTNHYGNGPFGACPNQDGLQAPSNAFVQGGGGLPLCVAYGVQAGGYQTSTADREIVANFHFGIPHKKDGGRDDVQVLYDTSAVLSTWADSINDLGGLAGFQRMYNFLGPNGFNLAPTSNLSDTACWVQQNLAGSACASGGPSPFPYQDGYIYAPGTSFGQAAGSATVDPYYFPNSPTNRDLYSGIPLDHRGTTRNDTGIVKVQYQKNIGSNAYARIYGYTFYSDWLMNSPNEATLYYGLAGLGWGDSGDYPSPDYELETHTRGVAFEYANQINSANLVRFTANYTTASLNRFNNATWDGNSLDTHSTNLVDGSGNCYSFVSGKIGSCFSGSTSGTYGDPTRAAYCATAGNTCAALQPGMSWVVTRPGGQGTTNGIIPKFTTFSLEDEWRPTDKLDFNLGVRLERYQYDLVNSNNPMFNFWFNAAQNVYCYDPATLQPILTPLSPLQPPPASPVTTKPGAPCPAGPSGQQGLHPNGKGGALLFSAIGPSTLAHTIFSPRIGGTYTLNPDTVLRFSAGKFTQPTPAAFEQYLDQYGARAAKSDFSHFFGFGFFNPSHDNPVQTSNNFDFSLEKHLKGTDITLKLSPFYRFTTHQSVTVPLGPNFVSAVNLGTQKSTGVEFQIQKGDPNRDGLSGSISYTYTSAKIKFENAPNGRNAIDLLNDYIKSFNGLTQAGGGAPFYCSNTTTPTPLGNPSATTAAGCSAYTPALDAKGNPLTVNPIVNPYYGMSQQGLLDRNGYYPTYPNAPPGDAPSGESTAISPSFFAGWLQYKHGRFSIAPNFVLAQGNAYGSPTDLYGLDPRTCSYNQGTTGAVPATSPNANDADYYQCGATISTNSGNLAIPDPNLGHFANLGQYRNPWQLNIGAQLRYDMSNKITATLDLANVFNRCFGGTKTPWSNAYKPGSFICGYGDNAGSWVGSTPGAGFFYGASPQDKANGTAPFSNTLLYPYGPTYGALPFQAYFQVQIKL